MRYARLPQLFAAALLSCVLMAPDCEHDPPPDVTLLKPAGGSYAAGEPLRLKFSEPIDARTLVIRVWRGERDIENNLTASNPLLQCNVTLPCGNTKFTVHDAAYVEIELDRPVSVRLPEGEAVVRRVGLFADDPAAFLAAVRQFTQPPSADVQAPAR